MTELTTAPTAAGEAAKPRVLIVDDSRIVRATIIKHVKGRYAFREETDGEAGWAALLVDPGIQVVISDLGMPKLDGYGLLERIRGANLARIRDLPFVIISGDEDEASRAKAKALGATDFITKGIGTAELLARLDSLVKLSTTQDELKESREHRLDDPVSGLKSRLCIELELGQALSHGARHGLPASVLVIGIDRLDALRSQHGEATIAQLLRRFGQMVATRIRREDSFGHYDKWILAAVTPSADMHSAQVFAGRLREAVELANVGYQGQRIALTVSIGIASCSPDAGVAAAEFIEIAAARMRAAAAAGGNRIVGCHGADAIAPLVPTLDTALAMLRAGHGAEIRGSVVRLALSVLPLLSLANDECKLGLPLTEIESRLRDRAQAEKMPNPDVSTSSAGNP